jgi:hypothetical protein
VFVSIKPDSEDLCCNIQFAMAIDNLTTDSEVFIAYNIETEGRRGVIL